MNIRSFIQRHQLLSYFVLAYGITWGTILILLALKGFRFDTIQTTDILPMLLLMLLGPSTSSLVLTATLDERNGLCKLWTRMTQWRVGVQWWVIALLTIPLLVLAILSVLSAVVSPVFVPGFLLLGVVYGLLAGFLEELGWTGFATPRLLSKYNALTAGIILGLLWAFWHTLADFSANISTMGARWLLWIIMFWILPLTAYRILMTWVYTNTGSLLVAQLMHASYTGWLVLLSPATSFTQGLLWQAIFAASLWAMVAVVVILNRKQLDQKLIAYSPAGAREQPGSPPRA